MKYRNVLLLFIPILFAVMIVLIGILLIRQQKDFERVYLSESRAEIEQNVQLILDFFLPHLETQDLDLLDEFSEAFAQGNRSVTFFNERGDAVITAGNVDLRANHQDLPEIREARTQKKIGIAVRKDPGKEIWTVYAAAEAELPDEAGDGQVPRGGGRRRGTVYVRQRHDNHVRIAEEDIAQHLF